MPAAANRVLVRAYRLVDSGDAAGAVKILEDFRARRPKWQKRGDRDPQGYFHYMIDFAAGNGYLSLGDHAKAIQNYRHVLKSRPAFFPAWANLAKACYESRRFREAARAFEKAFETSEPENDDLLYYAAVSQVSAGDNTAALPVLKKLLDRNPQKVKAEWREYLVHVLFALKRNRQALPHVEILAETASGLRQKRWQEICLNQYIVLKHGGKALAYARNLVRQDPLYPLWWKMLASLDMEKRRYTDALASLMIYGYLTPLDADEMRLVADLSLNLDVPSQAVRFYERAWQQKKDPLTLKRLFFSYQRRHRPEKALEILETGLRLYPRPDLLLLQAGILLDMQQYRRAMAVVKKLTYEQPGNGRAWLMLGYAAMGLQDYVSARNALRKATHFKGQRKAAESVLKALDRIAHENSLSRPRRRL